MITELNYFSPNNKALTNSKMGDWLKCPNYFYRKHILGEVEKTTTKAFTIGDATDNLLTEFITTKDYVVCMHDGRTTAGKKERAEYTEQGKIILSEADYELIMSLAIAVQETDAYKELIAKGYKTQEIIQTPRAIGEHFQILAGKPDFYFIAGDTCTIVDLKTTTDINPDKYFYACQGYSYFRQLANYALILKANNPDIKKFICKHLTVAKVKDIFPVRIFELANGRIEQEMEAIETTISEIAKEKDFKKYNPSLDKATLIGEMWYEE